MSLRILSVLPLIFLNAAFAAEVNCSALFEGPPRIENRIYDHIQKVEKSLNGSPHENPYMIINSHQQFRYFDVNNRNELKLIGKYEIGMFNGEELNYLQNFFSRQLLEVQSVEENKYLVYRWIVTQDVPTDFNTGMINASDTVIRAAIAQVIQSISLEHNPHKKALLFLDVDNLGIVNYFPGGHTTGDEYIKAVIDVVNENLRSDDHLRYEDKDVGFKNYNGDEFFYLLDGTTENEIPIISKRVELALRTDPRIAVIKIKALGRFEIFKKFLVSLRQFSELENSGLLPYIQNTRVWHRLSESEMDEVKQEPKAFKKFISLFLQSAEVKKIGNNIKSLNLGATFGIEPIKLGDTLESALHRASQTMEESKIQKKAGQTKMVKEDIYFPEL
jgi:GGDEF domain-containing protein